MSVFSIIRFRIKQTISGERSRGILKFLAPDIFIGLFLVISPDSTRVEYFSVRVAIVATGVALFTALAETRRFFFSGGDIERFYFVRPTVSSRIASISGMLVLIFLIVAAVFVPALLLSPGGFRFIASGIHTEIMVAYLGYLPSIHPLWNRHGNKKVAFPCRDEPHDIVVRVISGKQILPCLYLAIDAKDF